MSAPVSNAPGLVSVQQVAQCGPDSAPTSGGSDIMKGRNTIAPSANHQAAVVMTANQQAGGILSNNQQIGGILSANQQAGGILSTNQQTGGIFLVNMSGNQAGSAIAIPQLFACGNQLPQLQQQQQQQHTSLQSPFVNPALFNSGGQTVGQPDNTNPQFSQAILNPSNQQILQNNAGVPLMPAGAATAFMLVPVQQIPVAASHIPTLQNAPQVVEVKSGSAATILPSTSSQQAPLQPGTKPSPSHLPTFTTLHNPPVSTNQPTNPAPRSLPNPQTLTNQVQAAATQFTFRPINDPHISSTIQIPANELAAANASPCPTTAVQQSVETCKTSSVVDGKTISVATLSDVEKEKTKVGSAKETKSIEDVTLTKEKPGGGEKREKRKKGPAPKLDENELCLVCGDRASGYHYGVVTCEGCKGFFRRSVMKKPTYKCKNAGKCEMDLFMRRKCQLCRLDKCRSVGMKDESVLHEANKQKTPGSASKSSAKKMKMDNKSEFVASPSHFAPNLSFQGDPVPNLTSQQRNLVEMLQANEQRFQWPTQEDVDKVTPWVETGDSHRCRASRFAHFTELAILIVQLVVEFTKQLPGFLSVSREDQIVLLKACTIEVMLLRAAKQYDKTSKAINFLNGKFYDKNSFYRAGMQVEFVDPIFEFCNSMAKLDLDEAEFALLVAINTFSPDRQNIKDIDAIQHIQDSYVELLSVYLKIHRPSDGLAFPRTLMKLVELRTLNNYHSEQIFALKVQDKQLPPLLAEIWDM